LKVIENYKEPYVDIYHRRLRFESKKVMEFDIGIPQLKILFDYIDSFEPLELHDNEKMEACEKKDFKYIPIPFWWNRKLESVIGTIRKYGVNIKWR